MKNPNVFLEETGVTHARMPDGSAITRCGTPYDHVQVPEWSDPDLLGVETENGVDCITRLVKAPYVDQWEKYEKWLDETMR